MFKILCSFFNILKLISVVCENVNSLSLFVLRSFHFIVILVLFLLVFSYFKFFYINQVIAFYVHILTRSAIFLSFAAKLKIKPN